MQEVRIAVCVRDYISRAEGAFLDVTHAVAALAELPRVPVLRLDALGRPKIVEYDPEDSDHLQLFAAPEVRRQWVQRRSPRQRWIEQQEIDAIEADGTERRARAETSVMTLDLFT